MQTFIILIFLGVLAIGLFGSAVATGSNVMYMSESDYIAIQQRIVQIYREHYPTGLLPTYLEKPLDSKKARIPYGVDGEVSHLVGEWSENIPRADIAVNYKDFEMYPREMLMYYTIEEQRLGGNLIIEGKRREAITKFFEDVDKDILYGINKSGATFNGGLLASGTKAENLDGTDSLLTGAQGLLDGLNNMYKKVPLKYRQNLPVGMLIDFDLYSKINEVAFDDGRTPYERFVSSHMMPNTPPGMQCAYLFPSDTILDIADIWGSGETDTEGTHHRLVAYGISPDICGKVMSRVPSRIAEDRDPFGGVKQFWGSVHAAYVLKSDGLQVSEQITYAAA